MEEPDPANQLLFTPRLYTADQWGACLTVDNVPTLPSYCKRTLVFSTPVSASEIENNDSQLEWIVELYPKVRPEVVPLAHFNPSGPKDIYSLGRKACHSFPLLC